MKSICRELGHGTDPSEHGALPTDRNPTASATVVVAIIYLFIYITVSYLFIFPGP